MITKRFTLRSMLAASSMLALLMTTPAALSLPLSPSDMPANWFYNIGATPSTAGFNHNTHTYVSTTSGTGSIFSYPSPSSPLALDIESTTLLNAKISSTGELESGTFALVGSSDSLGIATGTTLLSATITDVYWNPSGDPSLFQFRARVDFVSPALREATGPVKSLLIYDFVQMNDAFFNNPWNATFFGAGPTTSPGVWMSPMALPLTWDEVQASFSTGATDAPLSQYNATTDVYSIVSDIGSSAFPSFIWDLDTSTNIATDAVGVFNLNAIIDEMGIVNSGTASWVGGVTSLGIPAGNTLISGDVSEAFYNGSNARFEFLVTVDTIHPLLEAAVGPVQTLLVYDYQQPGVAFDENPWTVSFFDMPWTTGPDMVGSPESMMNADTDGDGIADAVDNCTTVSNASQRDTNGDGFGNACDPDLNDDGIVNFTDVALWVPFFNTATTGDADFDGDGVASFSDYAIYPQYFLKPPGPSQVSPSELGSEHAQETRK